MDGYSVKDAALVLGIPERRVWELIARGVLASSREGPDGMRVFLQPRTAPLEPGPADPRIYRADEPETPPRQNGNGGSHEMSPFRELLTEFRSLTERYGQALLALGEARGEVASLRSRVELLEARMDLRLPGTRPASTVAWEIPTYPAGEPPAEPGSPLQEEPPEVDEPPEVAEAAEAPGEGADFGAEPTVQLEPEPEPEPAMQAQADASADLPSPDVQPHGEAAPEPPSAADAAELDAAAADASPARQRRAESRRRKIKGGRSALAGIAEALARAEDPTLAELPGAEQAAEALAAFQREVDTTSEVDATSEVDTTHGAVGDEAPDAETTLADEAVASGELPSEATASASDTIDQEISEPPEAPEPEGLPEEPELYATVSMSAISVPTAGLVADEDDEGIFFQDAAAESEIMEVSFEADVSAAPETPAAEMEAPPEAAEPAELRAAEPAAEADAGIAFDERETQPPELVQIAAEPMPAEPEPPHELVAAPGSPYSTEVIEPDWFADGDFSWLEAAQAESAPETTTQAQPVGEAEPVADAEPMADAASEPSAPIEPMEQPVPSSPPTASGGAGFEPTAHDELRAEQEARAAIQDAFTEPAAGGPTFEEPAAYAAPPQDEIGDERSPRPAEAQVDEAQVDEAQVDEAQVDEAPEEAIQEAFSEAPSTVLEPMSEEAPEPPTEAPEELVEPPVEARAPDAPVLDPRADDGAAHGGPLPLAQPVDASTEAPSTGQGQSGEEELMWLGDEFEEAGLEIATQGWRSADAPARPAETPVLELSDAELSQLAADEGWDAAEVEAIRNLLGRPTPAPAETVARAEGTTEPMQPADAEPSAPDEPEGREPEGKGGDPLSMTNPPAPSRRHSMSSMSDPRWLKGRRGPAATAYRRLRRLFPG